MAWTMSAYPRGLSLLGDKAAAQRRRFGTYFATLTAGRRVRLQRTAAIAHIAVLGLAAQVFAGEPMMLVVLVSGLLVCLPPLMMARRAPASEIATLVGNAPPLSPLAGPADAPATATIPEPFSSRDVASLAPARPRAAALIAIDQQRRRQWTDLMARVSHELRTPLNAVIGFSDLMSSETLGPIGHPRYREYVGHIRESGQLLLKSAEDTLAITSLLVEPRSKVREPVALAAMVEEAHRFVAEVDQRIQRLLVIGLDDIEVVCDRRPLRQVLVNLMTEALDRIGEAGRMGLRAEMEQDLVRLEIWVDGDGAALGGETGRLPATLARTILELKGGGLLETTTGTREWRAITVLEGVTQADFFPLPPQ